MNRAKIAAAYVQLLPSMSNFFTSMTTQLRTGMPGVGSKSASMFGKAFATGFKALGLVGLISGTLTTAFGVIAGSGIIKGGLTRALNIENAQQTLKALGYSLGQVQVISQKTLDAVTGTIYSLDQGVGVAASALAAGVSSEGLTNYISLIADTATIAKAELGEIGLIFNGVQARGKAYSQDLNQLASRSIPIYQYLAKSLGVTGEALQKMIEDGKISSEIFQRAISENIAGAALSGADATEGAYLNLITAVDRFGEKATGPSLPIATKSFLALRDVIDEVSEALDSRLSYVWARISARALPAIDSIKQVLLDFIYNDFSYKATPFATYIDTVIEKFNVLKGYILQAWAVVKPFAIALFGLAQTIIRDLTPGFSLLLSVLPSIVPVFGVLLNIITNFGTVISAQIGETLVDVINLVVALAIALAPLVPTFLQLTGVLIGVASAVLDWLVPFVTGLVEIPGLIEAIVIALGIYFVGIKAVAVATKAWAALNAVMATIRTAWTGITAAMAAYRAGLSIATAVQIGFNAAMIANPVGLIVTGILLLIAALVALGVWIYNIATETTFFQDAWANVVKFVSESVTNIGKWFSDVGTNIGNFFRGIGEFVMGILKAIGNFFIGIINNIIRSINFVIGLINKLQIPVPDWLQDLVGAKTIGFNIATLGEIPGLYKGADILGSQNGTVVRVGDRGIPESIVGTGRMNKLIDNANAAFGNGGAGDQIHIEIVVRENEDADATARAVLRAIELKKRRKAR